MLTSTGRTGGSGRMVAAAVVLLVVLCALLLPAPASACSCMPTHPQTHYCNADYVIIARILRQRTDADSRLITYKIAIKKSYKMNDRARDLLRDGKLVTAADSSMCGQPLTLGKLYMIAGRSARVSLCSYAQPYGRMSLVERRGFAGGYRKGCECDVQMQMWSESGADDGMNGLVAASQPGQCEWDTQNRCQTRLGACVPSRGAFNATTRPACHWRSSEEYNMCLNEP